ncbi:MAG TPA: PP2C family protein-serine/threonine phosphatase [Anaerolineales bacterium]
MVVNSQLRATGMPLGLMPDMNYEEKGATLVPGDSLLMYSDGLVEAHNPQREMFGFPRLRALLQQQSWERGGPGLIQFLLAQLAQFTTAAVEQEDDVTFVTLERLG